jgi:hypothetical protein
VPSCIFGQNYILLSYDLRDGVEGAGFDLRSPNHGTLTIKDVEYNLLPVLLMAVQIHTAFSIIRRAYPTNTEDRNVVGLYVSVLVFLLAKFCLAQN